MYLRECAGSKWHILVLGIVFCKKILRSKESVCYNAQKG